MPFRRVSTRNCGSAEAAAGQPERRIGGFLCGCKQLFEAWTHPLLIGAAELSQLASNQPMIKREKLEAYFGRCWQSGALEITSAGRFLVAVESVKGKGNGKGQGKGTRPTANRSKPTISFLVGSASPFA